MARKTTQWFLSLQVTIFLLLIFVRGNEDAEDAYKNGKHLVLEYFLPINLPAGADVPLRREKRDVEGSGEDDTSFSELKENEDADNSTRSAVGKFILEGKTTEGSGEVDEEGEVSLEEEKVDATTARIMRELELLTMPQSDETTKPPQVIPELNLTSTEMVFDRSEDFDELTTPEETSTEVETTPGTLPNVGVGKDELETTTLESTTMENREVEATTVEETTTAKAQTTTVTEETIAPTEAMTVLPGEDIETVKPSPTTTTVEETTTAESPIVIPQRNVPEESATVPPTEETKTVPSTPVFIVADVTPEATEGLPTPSKPPATPEPVVEEMFKETKVDRKLEALPGNILQKENLSLAADPLLIVNTRLMDSEENVQLSSAEPKRLGAYIVIALILLSFMTLVGYITFKKRMHRKRQEFESNQESNDTEKALLSLSDYKDNSELEENHLKNNEITPIVVKSNSQINKFEKNTNFSSPKNLNTIANEKNIEKDNVLKSTAENLTQVIIEDSPKDVEEDKTAPGMEKLIVKTRIDQDSIPKKPIIINRSSAGYIPIPQDNS